MIVELVDAHQVEGALPGLTKGTPATEGGRLKIRLPPAGRLEQSARALESVN